MAVKYSLAKKASKFGAKNADGKYYACAQINEKTSLKQFSKLIAMQTTVSRADVTAVLVSAVENLVMELQRGNQVEFGELGKFRIQLSSIGTENAADFKSDINITDVNIQFVPGDELSKLFEDLEFTQVASRAVQRAALKAEKEGAKTVDIEAAKQTSKKNNGGSAGDDSGDDAGSGSGTGSGTGSDDNSGNETGNDSKGDSGSSTDDGDDSVGL